MNHKETAGMNLKKFKKRLRSLYSNWAKNRAEVWSGTNVLVVSTSADAQSYTSLAFFRWLLDDDFHDTAVVFTGSHVHFFSTPEKVSTFKSLEEAVGIAAGAKLVVHEKEENGLCASGRDEIVRTAAYGSETMTQSSPVRKPRRKTSAADDDDNGATGSSSSKVVVGCIAEEMPRVFEKKNKKVKGRELAWKDVTMGFVRLLGIENEEGWRNADGAERADEFVDEQKEDNADEVLSDEMANAVVDVDDDGESDGKEAFLPGLDDVDCEFAKSEMWDDEFDMGDEWVVL